MGRTRRTLPDAPAARPMHQLIRYGAVGGVATVVHYLALVAGVELAGWPAPLASGVGAVLGAQVAYAGNRWFTFVHRGALKTSWPRFQATAAAGALLGMAVVAFGVRLGLHYLVAQAVATLLALGLTFGINRAWTFAD